MNASPNSINLQWAETLDRVMKSIVVIRVLSVRSWDGLPASSSFATGFVVDSKRGLILSNRHVVTDGPTVADAVMFNKEEIDLCALYRDPVHDFGFYHYDPSKVLFQEMKEIELSPNDAHVGTDIRVVGNDNGEKLSILAGTLARVDRNAPVYTTQGYNDFNTFYYCAASNTSGGSSGSPIINIHGKCIALNCGGANSAASSYYLPLDGATRALHALQTYLDENGKQQQSIMKSPTAYVPRGTVRLIFRHRSFGELRRLGLVEETERSARMNLPTQPYFRNRGIYNDDALKSPYNTGLLVVHQVVKGGASSMCVTAGDILLKVNDEWCSHFQSLEDALDSCVRDKKEIQLSFERAGELHVVSLHVNDLHELSSPKQFLELSGAILHRVTLQTAVNNNLEPNGGVYVACGGFMLGNSNIPDTVLLKQIGDKRVNTLQDVATTFCSFANNERVVLRYQRLKAHREVVSVVRVCHLWSPIILYEHDESNGVWNVAQRFKYKSSSSPPPTISQIQPNNQDVITMDDDDDDDDDSKHNSNNESNKGFPCESLVLVKYEIPYCIDGITSARYIGTGIVCDTTNGFIVVDRNTVPSTCGDITINFSNSLELEGYIVFIHPDHNFTIIRYIPEKLHEMYSKSDTRVVAAEFSDIPLSMGDSTRYYGRTITQDDVVSLECTIKIIRPFSYSMLPAAPRFLATNEDIIRIDKSINDSCGGVFVDEHNRIQGVLFSYAYVNHSGRSAEKMEGTHVECIKSVLKRLQHADGDEIIRHYSLRAFFSVVKLSTVRTAMKLPNEWIDEIQTRWHDNAIRRRQLLIVRYCLINAPSYNVLLEGDVLLKINDDIYPTTFWDVESAVLNIEDECDVTVLRSGKVITVKVQTQELKSFGTDRLVLWCGLLLQEAHLSVVHRGFLPTNGNGVYISFYKFGSPAHKYKIYPRVWIVEMNGIPIDNLQTFSNVIKQFNDGQKVRLKTVDLRGKTRMQSLKIDYHYWQTIELKCDNNNSNHIYQWKILS